jgi:PAS domain S-box-containing protein
MEELCSNNGRSPEGNLRSKGLSKYGRGIFAGFALASLALLTVGSAGLYSMGQVVYRNDLVEHTHRVIESLDRVGLDLKNTENAQESYLLSGTDGLLQAASDERSALIQDVESIASLTADDPLQRRLVRALDAAINSRLSFLDLAIAVRQTQSLDAAASLMRADSRQLSEQIQQLIIEMSKEENDLLRRRNRELRTAGAVANGVTLFGSLAAILFVAFTALFISRAVEALRGRTADLAKSYQELLTLSDKLRERELELISSERTLRNQSALLRSVLESMAEGVIACNLDRRPFLFNAAAAQIFGQNDLDAGFDIEGGEDRYFLNDNSTTATQFEDLPLFRALRGEEVNNSQLLLERAKTGEQVWLEISARPLKGSEGEELGAVAVFRDIGQRKRAEQEQARLAGIIECSPDAIMSTTPEGIITSWNPGAEKLYGYTANQMIGKSSDVLFPSTKADEWQKSLRRVAEGEAVQHYGIRSLKSDGALIDISWMISPLRDKEGQLNGISLIGRNITESKRITRELEQRTRELERSNSELEQFAYSASHDLQEPLRMVASYVQLLQRRYQGKLDSDADDFIGYAVDGATRMKALINDVLTYSRAGRGKPLKPVEVKKALEWALSNLSLLISESKVVVTCDPMPTVLGDESQLGELFQNLIGNAIKFRGPQPLEIHVCATVRNSEWLFAIRDNGIGIEPQYFSRIFLMFQRLHGPQQYPGTGIGLAICRRIVERHGGQIWVESTPGNGTTFFFTLLTADPDEAVDRTKGTEDAQWETGKVAT